MSFSHCIPECLIRRQFALQPRAALLEAAENASDYYSVRADGIL